MKKNFAMWFVTFCVAIFGFVLAIITFFKRKHFCWRFKNEDDIFGDLDGEDGEDGEEEINGQNQSEKFEVKDVDGDDEDEIEIID